MNSDLFYKDKEGNEYELFEMPYIPGIHSHACAECCFLVLGVCKTPKTCTPIKEGNDRRNRKNLVKSGGWKKIEKQ